MRRQHIIAVFKAEYYTTTARFRQMRKWIPLLFVGGVLFFGYVLRIIFDFFRGDLTVAVPPLNDFFSIIAIFSYFTMFTPLLSPLGRVIYDGGARSRREVALSSPVASSDLLYGNLLSNLAFFLPFFSFMGTLALAPFIGNGSYSPELTAIYLFGVLSLLILIGLIAGTLISPIIFKIISSQKSNEVRALVTLAVSGMLILSLPLLRYYLEATELSSSSLGVLTYVPFTLAAAAIIYILYGVEIVVSINGAIGLLLIYVLILVVLGYTNANFLYELDMEEDTMSSVDPHSRSQRFLHGITFFLPEKLRNPTRSLIKASLRDIEHISRLTIGLAIAVFMIFALSSRGLFRNSTDFPENIELAVVIFALVLSAASVIFIEASSFTVQHRDMFALIKSAPKGPETLVLAKILQMFYLLLPMFVSMIAVLAGIELISSDLLMPLIMVMVGILFLLICLSLTIYLVNPSDNQEDLINFINLLFFYVIAFAIAVVPVYLVIADVTVKVSHIIVAFLAMIGIGYLSIKVSIQAFEVMNLETLDSPFSRKIITGIKSMSFFLLGWTILPIFSIPIFLQSDNISLLVILSSMITLTLPSLYFLQNRRRAVIRTTWIHSYKLLFASLSLMLAIGFGFFLLTQIFNPETNLYNLTTILDSISQIEVIIILVITGISEELFFRYFLLDYLREELRNKYAIMWSALLFAIIHLSNPFSFVNAFMQGIILGWVKIKTGSVQSTVFLHLNYNILLVLLL